VTRRVFSSVFSARALPHFLHKTNNQLSQQILSLHILHFITAHFIFITAQIGYHCTLKLGMCRNAEISNLCSCFLLWYIPTRMCCSSDCCELFSCWIFIILRVSFVKLMVYHNISDHSASRIHTSRKPYEWVSLFLFPWTFHLDYLSENTVYKKTCPGCLVGCGLVSTCKNG
jgi:hypothetical protein